MNCIGCLYENKTGEEKTICLSCARWFGGETFKDRYVTLEDMVNHPNHYQLDGLNVEVIDLIRSVTGEKYEGYLLGNLIKYVMRYQKKNGAEDLKKAKVYLDWLIEVSE